MPIKPFSGTQNKPLGDQTLDPQPSITVSQRSTAETSSSSTSIGVKKTTPSPITTCIHSGNFYFGNDFKIASEISGILRVRAGNQESCYTFDALEGSWAGRWLLVKFRWYYISRIFMWLWRGLGGDNGGNVFRLMEIDGGNTGRYFELIGGCCSGSILMWEEELIGSIPGRLLLW